MVERKIQEFPVQEYKLLINCYYLMKKLDSGFQKIKIVLINFSGIGCHKYNEETLIPIYNALPLIDYPRQSWTLFTF